MQDDQWRRKKDAGDRNGEAFPVYRGLFSFLSTAAQSTPMAEKSATGTEHKDQGQIMRCSRRESGKEGSPCHYYYSASFAQLEESFTRFSYKEEGGGLTKEGPVLGDVRKDPLGVETDER
jgi:hypothetical protein